MSFESRGYAFLFYNVGCQLYLIIKNAIKNSCVGDMSLLPDQNPTALCSEQYFLLIELNCPKPFNIFSSLSLAVSNCSCITIIECNTTVSDPPALLYQSLQQYNNPRMQHHCIRSSSITHKNQQHYHVRPSSIMVSHPTALLYQT